MNDTIDLNAINTTIQTLKKAAEQLKQMGKNFPSVYRNADRILASIKMLEMNITDCIDPDAPN